MDLLFVFKSRYYRNYVKQDVLLFQEISRFWRNPGQVLYETNQKDHHL